MVGKWHIWQNLQSFATQRVSHNAYDLKHNLYIKESPEEMQMMTINLQFLTLQWGQSILI